MSGKTGKYSKSSGEWKTTYVPHTIYFYHRSPAGTRVYLWINPDDNPIEQGTELTEHIVRLTKNARSNGNDPRPIGKKFSDVPWWKRSYVVIVSENETFDPGDAVEIKRGDGHANHCFFDGGDAVLTVDGTNVNVMWTVNYMMDKHGDQIDPGKTHKFKWKFNPNKRPPFIEDGNGTNMGPPVPPPG